MFVLGKNMQKALRNRSSLSPHGGEENQDAKLQRYDQRYHTPQSAEESPSLNFCPLPAKAGDPQMEARGLLEERKSLIIRVQEIEGRLRDLGMAGPICV